MAATMGSRGPRLVAALLAACLLHPPAAASGSGRPTVEVESHSLRIDHDHGRALFEGDVRARYGDISLACSRLEVNYDRGGAVVSLLASGGVRVQRGAARASAATARLEARTGILVLEGGPLLRQGAHQLEGQRITVDLASGRIEVTSARGRFEVDLGGGR